MKKLILLAAVVIAAVSAHVGSNECYIMPDDYFVEHQDRLAVCLAETNGDRFENFVMLARSIPGFDDINVRPANVRDLEESK